MLPVAHSSSSRLVGHTLRFGLLLSGLACGGGGGPDGVGAVPTTPVTPTPPVVPTTPPVVLAQDTIIHVNAGDPVFLTQPVSGGEVVEFSGERDASGMPRTLLAYRRFSPSSPKIADVLTLGSNHLPASIVLRNGAQFSFTYLDDGQVLMTAAVVGSTPKTVLLNWRQNTSTGQLSPSAAIPLFWRTQSLRTSSPDEVVRTLAFQVKESSDGPPVAGATIIGSWSLGLMSGSVTATAGPTPGTYVSTVPARPTPKVQDLIRPVCEGGKSLFGNFCGLLSAGKKGTDPVSGKLLEAQFAVAAVAACTAVLVGQVEVCAPLVAFIDIACEIVDKCEVADKALDLFADFNSQQALKVDVDVAVGPIHQVSTSDFSPPVASILTIPVSYPALLDHIVVRPSTISVEPGVTATLAAEARTYWEAPLGGRQLSWSSSDNAIASVAPNGAVLGVKAGGPVTITAASGATKGSASVTVVGASTLMGNWRMVSYRGISVGGVCGAGCAWVAPCPTCRVRVDSGKAVFTQKTWTISIYESDHDATSDGFGPSKLTATHSGTYSYTGVTTGLTNVPQVPECSAVGLYSKNGVNQGYCSMLPAGALFTFDFGSPFGIMPGAVITSPGNMTSAFGGQTVWVLSQ